MQEKRKYTRTKYKYSPSMNMLVLSTDRSGMAMTHSTARDINNILRNTVSIKFAAAVSGLISLISFSIGFFL